MKHPETEEAQSLRRACLEECLEDKLVYPLRILLQTDLYLQLEQNDLRRIARISPSLMKDTLDKRLGSRTVGKLRPAVVEDLHRRINSSISGSFMLPAKDEVAPTKAPCERVSIVEVIDACLEENFPEDDFVPMYHQIEERKVLIKIASLFVVRGRY